MLADEKYYFHELLYHSPPSVSFRDDLNIH